jgi:hypothetical protein
MGVYHVQQYQLDKVWPDVEKYIKSALDTGFGELDEHQARMMVAKGMAELFIAQEGDRIVAACLVEFANYPNYRAANIIAIGGRGVIKYWDDFKEWMRMGGASYVEGHCHESVARLWGQKLGMEKTYQIMRGAL